MLEIWLIVALALFVFGLAGLAWCDGRDELGAELHELVIVLLFGAVIWPGILAAVIIVSPFVGFYYFIKWVAFTTNKKGQA